MFDIGWTELLVIAIVLIVVVGPKDLPPMLRAFGKMTSNLRKMAGEFRSQFDEALRESELDDVRRTISDAQRLNPTNALREAINPLRQMGQEIRNDLQKSTQAPSAPEMTKTDIEAQQAIEGADDHQARPETADIFPSTASPLPASPVVPVTAPAQSQPVSVERQASAPVVEKPKAVRKAPARAKPPAEAAAAGETVAKRRRSPAVKSMPDATNGELAAPAMPARKPAPKKTQTPRDDA
ncbi:twin-arginine translocase subunit TatB [Rhizobium deserti]|uniref:Sec-independent protein translocase protein TatB n=1 Tax=Rhizobium deserti TaxID=2547961 RepID=A0A4R5UM62_9HYPH|nr:Sec-independent protein translocase protein TatB [Rhizobium deserti]TDK38818.1 twin-arginine translocase subunit TatB [Rhizobium deserti]